jgi:uncharacterized protein
MPSAGTESIAIAILAKAPVAGLVKTRLIPALGAEGAAQLQGRLIVRAAETACAAGTGPVTLWAAPDPGHPLFGELAARLPIELARQPDGDLGERMLAAVTAQSGPTLIIGSDCPVLTPDHLRAAAEILRGGWGCVMVPAQDGGYVVIGMRRAAPGVFRSMTWSVPTVLKETRRRLARAAISTQELAPLWDVDNPADVERLRDAGLEALLALPPHPET